MKLLYMLQIKNGAGLQSNELSRGKTSNLLGTVLYYALLKTSGCGKSFTPLKTSFQISLDYPAPTLL